MKHLKLVVSASVCIAAVAGAVAINNAGADSVPSTLVAITPCRRLDTRPAGVGEHPTPFQSGETVTLPIVGSFGQCVIPTGATAIAANVTILNPTALSWLTLFPADADLPATSNLNWVAGQPPTPNQVTVGLSVAPFTPIGAIKVNNAVGGGTVDVIIDIVAYYAASGGTGPTMSAGNWGDISRNTIGSPVSELRSGPFVGPAGPASGSGSLDLSVGGPTEKVAFGNEVEFVGDPFDVLTDIGFDVFTVPENNPHGPAAMPNIAIEIDPNMAAFPLAQFSTLVFVPDVPLLPGWTGLIDATSPTAGLWGGNGAAFDGTPCSSDLSLCTWDELQTHLNDGGDPPRIFTVAVTKGRDQEWHGAVDVLQVGDTVYDFEEFGVVELAAP